MPVSTFPFKGHYEGDNFTVDDVIASLSAQRILIKQAVEFLEELDPDFDATKVVIRVISIEEGSLHWDLIVEIWNTYQTQIVEKVSGSIEEALGVDIPEAYEPFVALATMAVVFWGLQYAYDRVRRRKEHDKEKRPAPSVHIEGSYNTVVQLVAEHVDMSQEKVERALNEALFNDRAKVAKAATDFVRPAKFRNSSISVIGAPEVTRETVAEVPSDAEMAKTSEVESIRLNEVLLSIRGTDRDNHQAGWRALIENDDRFPKRLPLVLSPAINLEDLANHVRVEANVVVEVERFFDGSIIPRRIHLVEYRPLSD